MNFKNYQAFKDAIKKLPFITIEAEAAHSPEPPYAGYFREDEKSWCADGKIAFTVTKMTIELYTLKEDNDSEKILEKWFEDNNISYQKFEREWLSNEKWYVTFYEFELIF